jgi:hypothetical protein
LPSASKPGAGRDNDASGPVGAAADNTPIMTSPAAEVGSGKTSIDSNEHLFWALDA